MQTRIAERFRNDPDIDEADRILRTCVHCGFCLATCPTYQLLGDELDSPRGRIYLMKKMFEGEAVGDKTQLHLDRCLTCRSCETTCPSGVQYGRLIDIGRAHIEKQVPRSAADRLKRTALQEILPRGQLFGSLLKVGQAVRALLPSELQNKVPVAPARSTWPPARHARKVLVFDGCVQPSMGPNINAAAARVLDRLGISLVRAESAGCCGAVQHHLGDHEASRVSTRRVIDQSWRHVEAGVEAIMFTASGCGAMLVDYAHLLRNDGRYAEKARRYTELSRDISQVLSPFTGELARLARAGRAADATAVAFHSPCTLQHGLKLRGVVEPMLEAVGCRLTPVANPHLCCGSAGTYSILQPYLSKRLLANKVTALEEGRPAVVATANIGCLNHLQGGTRIPVKHWIEIVDERTAAR